MTIAQFFSQNSFLVHAILVLGGWRVVLIARRARARAWLVWVAAAAVALAISAQFAICTVPTRTFESAADVQPAIAVGMPTLVEFYLN